MMISKIYSICGNHKCKVRLVLILTGMILGTQMVCMASSVGKSDDVSTGYTLRRTQRGIMVLRDSTGLRAFESFTPPVGMASVYADALNRYRRDLPDSVRLYAMLIPTAEAYYLPVSYRQSGGDQSSLMHEIYRLVAPGISCVDLFDTLRVHSAQPIYTRTDHHWGALGAYYAARNFALKACVALPEMDDFKPCFVKRFVGTMYYFSKDLEIKNNPEDFTYYVPKDSMYVAKFQTYRLDSHNRVLAKNDWVEAPFFKSYPEGSGRAYSTYMGGDVCTVSVKTSSTANRRLLIIKDSYGNALPAFLFGSFSRVDVVDFRFFIDNIKDYIITNGITDVLIVNNMMHATQKSTSQKLIGLLCN